MELTEIRKILAGVGLASLMAGSVLISGCATTGTSS
ncbi:MAG: selenobiotic family radical SAM modification target peptide [Nitrospirae bacterium]|nr:selenobiotic family radical SAM modification target peptide [Nitrospirota bacterium]